VATRPGQKDLASAAGRRRTACRGQAYANGGMRRQRCRKRGEQNTNHGRKRKKTPPPRKHQTHKRTQAPQATNPTYPGGGPRGDSDQRGKTTPITNTKPITGEGGRGGGGWGGGKRSPNRGRYRVCRGGWGRSLWGGVGVGHPGGLPTTNKGRPLEGTPKGCPNSAKGRAGTIIGGV